ncbi:MAG: hypothetical protein IKF18_07190 [Erysipelotrichaceae bacterium]|nr:hypothetical protein [Erysipelotrichaceae bacterium]
MTALDIIYNSKMVNEPLFIEDFVNENVKYDSAKTMLSNWVRAGILMRYAQGIYYIPKNTVLGKSTIPFESVIERKYIADKNQVFGYYSGMTLLNSVGLTTQVPNIPEITTNKEATRKRKVTIGKRSVIVRKSEIEISEENAVYLQFLDIFRYADIDSITKSKEKIIAFFDRNRLNFNSLQQIEKEVAAKLRKALRRSGIYDELAYR